MKGADENDVRAELLEQVDIVLIAETERLIPATAILGFRFGVQGSGELQLWILGGLIFLLLNSGFRIPACPLTSES